MASPAYKIEEGVALVASEDAMVKVEADVTEETSAPQRALPSAVFVGLALLLGAAAFAASTRATGVVTELVEDSRLCYSCKNGDPGISKRYKDGAWGTIDGDWYIVASNADSSEVDCLHASFDVRGDSQGHVDMEIMYEQDEEDEYMTWNQTFTKYKKDIGKWIAGEDDNREWIEVWATGQTPKGNKWFGLYFCAGETATTRRGLAYIISSTSKASTTFLEEAKEKMEDAGLLDYGKFYHTKQNHNCNYTWS